MACTPLNLAYGSAMRIANYLDCHTETIGREGYLALAGYSAGSGLLAAVLTIFVALIGYRLLLGGGDVGLRDGAGWALKLGVVLALLAGWPAFQTLFYDVAIAGPGEIAGRITAASGIPADQFDARVQRAYDSIRLGLEVPLGGFANPGAAAMAQANAYELQPPMPRTASFFVIAAHGFSGAAGLAAAFLLAIAPFPIMALLFGPGFGFFIGWLRALLTAIFAGAAVSVASVLMLTGVESELARAQTAIGADGRILFDDQAMSTIVIIFMLVALALVFVSARLSGSLAAALTGGNFAPSAFGARAQRPASGVSVTRTHSRTIAAASAGDLQTSRVTHLVDALDRSMRRESGFAGGAAGAYGWAGGGSGGGGSGGGRSGESETSPQRAGGAGYAGARLALGRRHRSSLRRDSKT